MTVSMLGCGWYGLALAKALIAQGVKVNGSTTSVDKLTTLSAAGVSPYLIDLSADITASHTGFFDCDVLVIAIPPKTRSGEGAAYIPKLQRVIEAIQKYQLKKVILVSSTGVYADLNTEVDELSDPQPNTPAGIILSQAEELFKQQTEFKTTVIRFGGLLGPGRDPGRFFAGRKDIPNGLAPINLIHLDDCIGLTQAVINMDAFGYTLNACTPHHPPKADFYTQAAAKSGLELPGFTKELKEWKIVNSIIFESVLKYQFKVTNWLSWLQ